MKGRIKITFIDQYVLSQSGRVAIADVSRFGTEESGIDGGGLFKEFLTKWVSAL